MKMAAIRTKLRQVRFSGQTRRSLRPPVPKEREEQIRLAAWLDLRGVLFCHVPNESRAHVRHRVNLARQGVKPGVPDVLIFSRPPLYPPGHRPAGVAIELKRQRGPSGGLPGAVSDAQMAWQGSLEREGWLVRICYGADEAIAWLGSLGVGR